MTTRLEPVWRTVPVEPTVEMRIAGVQAWRDDEVEAPVTRIWQAMLQAAPAPDGMRQQVETVLREQIYLQHIGEDVRVVGYGQATDAILAIIAKGEGR